MNQPAPRGEDYPIYYPPYTWWEARPDTPTEGRIGSLLRQAPILTICAQHRFPRLADLEQSRCLGCQIPLGAFIHFMGKPTPFDRSVEGIYKVILFEETPVSIVMLPDKHDSADGQYTSYVFYLANPITGFAC